MCLFVPFPKKTSSGTIPEPPISDAAAAAAASSRLCPAQGCVGGRGALALLLTGVICASGIDVVCQPIKIFEGNVYFLERIAPAAWELFLNKAIYAQEFAIVRRSAGTSW